MFGALKIFLEAWKTNIAFLFKNCTCKFLRTFVYQKTWVLDPDSMTLDLKHCHWPGNLPSNFDEHFKRQSRQRFKLGGRSRIKISNCPDEKGCASVGHVTFLRQSARNTIFLCNFSRYVSGNVRYRVSTMTLNFLKISGCGRYWQRGNGVHCCQSHLWGEN